MSAKDPIEELFRDNQHGLDEKPRSSLWDKIEEKLDEKPIVSKKNNWWKYSIAAGLMVGLSLASYLFLFDAVSDEVQETRIVYQPAEITEENASVILDKLEEQKQSVVMTQTNTNAPEIYKEKELTPHMKPAHTKEIYDMMPAEAMIYEPAPQTGELKVVEETFSQEKEGYDHESIVFRGSTPEKKGKNYITQKGVDERRMGNMAEKTVPYESSLIIQKQISIPVKNYLVQYDLISQTDSSIVFSNANIVYPNEIVFQKTNDSIKVIYSGKDSKKNSNESKEIQKHIEENKSNILTNFGF